MRLYEMQFFVVLFCCGNCGFNAKQYPVSLAVTRHTDEDACTVGVRCSVCETTVLVFRLFPQVEVTFVNADPKTNIGLSDFWLREYPR